MSSFARFAGPAIVALGLSWSPSLWASEISYIFDFVVTDASQGPPGGGVNVGDRGTMVFVVNAATPSDPARSDSTTSFYPGAIVGGGATIGAEEWTFGGPDFGVSNYAMIQNDKLPDLGGPSGDLFVLHGPLTGRSVIPGFPPIVFSAVLYASRPAPNDALTSLAFPTSLDLAQFNQIAEASIGYWNGGGVGSYLLDIDGIRVVPEPPGFLLFALALAAMIRQASTASRAARARPS